MIAQGFHSDASILQETGYTAVSKPGDRNVQKPALADCASAPAWCPGG